MATFQRSTFSVAQLRDRIRGDLGLRGNGLITDGDVDAWAQEAISIIGGDTAWFRTSATLNIVANQSAYDLPDDLLSVVEVRYNNGPLLHLTERRMDGGEQAWGSWWDWRSQASGTPIGFYMLGSTSINLYPPPATNITGGLVILYAATPPAPTSDTERYQVPLGNDTAIVSYCLYKAALKATPGEGSDKVQLYKREWDEALLQARSNLADVMEGSATVVGGDARWRRGYFPWWNPDRTIPGP